MQAFLHWVQFTHVEISWCSTRLVIDVNFVALIKNVSLPFQTTIESVSCLVGLGWFFSVHLALRNSSLLELCLSADARDLFQRCCWNRSHFTAASAGVCGTGKMGQCCLQNPSESLLQGLVLSLILQDAPAKKCSGTTMATALPDRLNHRKWNQRVLNIGFSLVPCSTLKSVVVQRSQTPIPEFGSAVLAALDKTTLPSRVSGQQKGFPQAAPSGSQPQTSLLNLNHLKGTSKTSPASHTPKSEYLYSLKKCTNEIVMHVLMNVHIFSVNFAQL